MTSAPDSFEIIRELFTRHAEPTKEQAKEVAPALIDVYERLMRVRVVAPTADISAKFWRLMELVGIKPKPARPLPVDPMSRTVKHPAPPREAGDVPEVDA